MAIRQVNLATAFYYTKRYKEAYVLLQKACETFLEKLGNDHPSTKSAESWLAGVEAALSKKGGEQG